MHRLLPIVSIIILSTACSNLFPTRQLSHSTSSQTEFQRPNIIVIMTDDQGYGDLAVHGNPIVQTPNLDLLANESINFSNYHVSPTCSPSRAALLTGHWSNRTGVWHTIMGRSMLRENELTVADILKSNGYHTAMFGKWHLGDNYPYRPHDRGFELAFYHGGGGVGQTPDTWDNAYFDGKYRVNDTHQAVSGYVTDVFFQQAIQYIKSVQYSDKPFFAYISTNAPHGPMHAPVSYSSRYKNLGLSVFEKNFLGMITNIDDNVASLRNFLRENNLDDNTLLIFTTDNGTAAGERIFNAGMRGKKGSPYEGGHRVPLLMHWPRAGLNRKRIIDTLTAHIDIMPTLLDYSQSEKPATLEFDGLSMRPLIDNVNHNWPERILITDSQRILMPEPWRKTAVMSGQWRLVNKTELYDINKDPSQQHNIAEIYPEQVIRLQEFYHQWWNELSPGFGDPTPIYIGSKKANPVHLNAHDWIGENIDIPWHQGHIRNALSQKNDKHTGYWWLKVVEEGDYQFELRRWPHSINLPINAPLSRGHQVPGEPAYRTRPGKAFMANQAFFQIGIHKKSISINGENPAVIVKAHLTPGYKKLRAGFIDSNNREIGAYFVTINKIPNTVNESKKSL